MRILPAFLLVAFLSYEAEAARGLGIHGGIATDVSFELGFGGGVNYAFFTRRSKAAWEFGLDVIVHSGTTNETEQEGSFIIDYKTDTELLVFAVMGNGLFNYTPYANGIYFVAGAGFVVASVSWSENRVSRLPGSPPNPSTTESDGGTSVGNAVNLGIGGTFKNGLDLRLQTPMLFFYDTPGRATSFVPTFSFTVGYRFR